MSTKTLLDVLPGGTQKDDDESVGIVRFMGKIRTVHLWTTNQNICRLTLLPTTLR